MTDPRPVITAIRDGRGLDGPGAALIAQGLANGSISDAQAGAFAMAVLVRGIGVPGRVALIRAMRDSGHVLHWDLPGPVVDKHSTGGIGDATSLVLAPLLAARGMFVPMISGRGLGHTGGTLDKLEAIPGYLCDQPEDDFRRIVRTVGCAIVAATGDVAPADRRLYAIRDESATVESIDLITASILSKKLAAGLQALVLDVKAGSGAFLRQAESSGRLAQALVETANGAGCATSALITDMDQPVARSAGNALEIAESIRVLKGEAGALRDLTLALGSEVLRLVGQGDAGLSDLLDRPEAHLIPAPVIRPVPAPESRVAQIDVTALGHAVVALGGGRVRAGEAIDPRVGLSMLAKLDEQVGPGRPLALVHAADDTAAEVAIAAVTAAYRLGDGAAPGPLVRDRIAP